MVALMINMIVGAGIFGLPARVHAQSGVYGLLAYAACAVVIAGIALCLGEVASRFASTGGPFLYATEAFGPLTGFLVGWLMTVTRMTSLAIIANVMTDYLAFLWPPAAAGPTHTAVMVVALASLAGLNVLGVRQGAGFCAALAVVKLVPMLLFVIVGLFYLEPQRFAGAAPSGSTFSQSVLQLIFAFGGFESAIVTAGEMKDPRRDAPFSMLVGIGAATLLYVLIQAVCIGTLPDLASSKRPLADAAARFAGAAGGGLISVGAFLSSFGAMAGTMLAGPRVLFAMAERGRLPGVLAALHARFRTPYVAILVLTAGGIALAATGTFTYLIGLNVISRLIQYLATALAVFALRRRDSGSQASFSVPAAGFVVPFTVIACGLLIARSSVRELRDVVIALVLGLAVYGLGALATRRSSSAKPPA